MWEYLGVEDMSPCRHRFQSRHLCKRVATQKLAIKYARVPMTDGLDRVPMVYSKRRPCANVAAFDSRHICCRLVLHHPFRLSRFYRPFLRNGLTRRDRAAHAQSHPLRSIFDALTRQSSNHRSNCALMPRQSHVRVPHVAAPVPQDVL